MSLEETITYWLRCDNEDCHNTYGTDGSREDYENEDDLYADALKDGWSEDEDGSSCYCDECSAKGLGRDLTPLEQATLMHGRKSAAS